jgi:hypothetical protein
MKLQNIKNGKIIKVGSIVKMDREKYYIYKISKIKKSGGQVNIGLETLSNKNYNSFDFVEPRYIGCRVLKVN